jgi:hypothetical protein
MTDVLTKRPADRSQIDTGKDQELEYWCRKFGVTREKLVGAVGKVGNSSKAVAKELSKAA